MAKKEQEWALFVDESGDFGDPSDAVAVGGVLVAQAPSLYSASEIRKALETAVPGFPWPLHASFLNQPAYVAVAAYQREPAVLDALRPGFGAAVRAAISACESAAPGDLDSVTAAVRQGDKPAFDALTRLREVIRLHAPEALAQLTEVTREAWRAIHVVAERLIAVRAGDRPGAFFVAASETACGDAGACDTSRYFAVLKAAIDRSAALIERYPGQHRLSLNVQQRHVYDKRFGKRVMLTPQHVGAVVNELRARHLRIHFLVNDTPDYGSNVSVEYVLADFLANRSRRVLDDTVSALPIVEERAGKYFGAPLRSGDPARSHLAASGEASDIVGRVKSSTETRTDTERTAGGRRWAFEQAFQWATS